jgi:hypothetical protein
MSRNKNNRYHRIFTEKPVAEAEVKAIRPVFYERGFRVLAVGVVLIMVVLRVFDFSLWPLVYKGLYITRPYDGLHSWHFTSQAWAARSHVKYGLDYLTRPLAATKVKS